MRHRRGMIVDTSRSGGLNIGQTWCTLFEENERAFRLGRYDDVLTDEQLTDAMCAAFPKRDRKYVSFTDVRRQRGRYNRGKLTRGVKPRKRSHRYVHIISPTYVDGIKRHMHRATSHGTPIRKNGEK